MNILLSYVEGRTFLGTGWITRQLFCMCECIFVFVLLWIWQELWTSLILFPHQGKPDSKPTGSACSHLFYRNPTPSLLCRFSGNISWRQKCGKRRLQLGMQNTGALPGTVTHFSLGNITGKAVTLVQSCWLQLGFTSVSETWDLWLQPLLLITILFPK